MPTPRPATLLYGDPGTGKSDVLRTLLDVADEVCILLLEQHTAQVLANTPADRFHWHIVEPSEEADDALLDHLDKVNTLSYASLSKLRGINKSAHNQLISIVKATMNFKCHRCGKDLGNWRDFGPNMAVGIDSLTELAAAAMELQIGSQPVVDKGDYNVAQQALMPFLKKFCYELTCWRAMTAHPIVGRDELDGARKVMPMSVGQALNSKIPKLFSNVVQTVRLPGPKFEWSTNTPDWVLKATSLPWSEHLPPTFLTIKEYMQEMGKWEE